MSGTRMVLTPLRVETRFLVGDPGRLVVRWFPSSLHTHSREAIDTRDDIVRSWLTAFAKGAQHGSLDDVFATAAEDLGAPYALALAHVALDAAPPLGATPRLHHVGLPDRVTISVYRRSPEGPYGRALVDRRTGGPVRSPLPSHLVEGSDPDQPPWVWMVDLDDAIDAGMAVSFDATGALGELIAAGEPLDVIAVGAGDPTRDSVAELADMVTGQLYTSGLRAVADHREPPTVAAMHHPRAAVPATSPARHLDRLFGTSIASLLHQPTSHPPVEAADALFEIIVRLATRHLAVRVNPSGPASRHERVAQHALEWVAPHRRPPTLWLDDEPLGLLPTVDLFAVATDPSVAGTLTDALRRLLPVGLATAHRVEERDSDGSLTAAALAAWIQREPHSGGVDLERSHWASAPTDGVVEEAIGPLDPAGVIDQRDATIESVDQPVSHNGWGDIVEFFSSTSPTDPTDARSPLQWILSAAATSDEPALHSRLEDLARAASGTPPAIDVDRCVLEALDLVSGRLDAWVTSLAAQRVAATTSVRHGAYGWARGFRRDPDPEPVSTVWYLAPSPGHARVAAAFHDDNSQDAVLTSRSVREAAELLRTARAYRNRVDLALAARFETLCRTRPRLSDRVLPSLRAAFPVRDASGFESRPINVRAVIDQLVNTIDDLYIPNGHQRVEFEAWLQAQTGLETTQAEAFDLFVLLLRLARAQDELISFRLAEAILQESRAGTNEQQLALGNTTASSTDIAMTTTDAATEAFEVVVDLGPVPATHSEVDSIRARLLPHLESFLRAITAGTRLAVEAVTDHGYALTDVVYAPRTARKQLLPTTVALSDAEHRLCDLIVEVLDAVTDAIPYETRDHRANTRLYPHLVRDARTEIQTTRQALLTPPDRAAVLRLMRQVGLPVAADGDSSVEDLARLATNELHRRISRERYRLDEGPQPADGERLLSTVHSAATAALGVLLGHRLPLGVPVIGPPEPLAAISTGSEPEQELQFRRHVRADLARFLDLVDLVRVHTQSEVHIKEEHHLTRSRPGQGEHRVRRFVVGFGEPVAARTRWLVRVDQWNETIPGHTAQAETTTDPVGATAAAIQTGPPPKNRAPAAVLVAAPPAPTSAWDPDELTGAVLSALACAELRPLTATDDPVIDALAATVHIPVDLPRQP